MFFDFKMMGRLTQFPDYKATGKTDKNGSKIWYDGDTEGTGANQGRFVVGMNPSIVAAKGKTLVFRNKILAHGATYDFIITYRYH